MPSVIRSFHDKGTEDVFDGIESAVAARSCPRVLWPIARRKLDQLNRVRAVRELSIPPGNRLERLRGDREGRYRVCFRWEDGDAHSVEITDYH